MLWKVVLICIIFFLAQKRRKRFPNVIDLTYESAKVARNKAAQGKRNVQKYDKAWKHRNYAVKYYVSTGSDSSFFFHAE